MKLLKYKSKSPVESSLIFTFFTFLQPAVSLLLLPFYLKYLSTDEYGVYTLLTTITALTDILGGLNVSASMSPFYYKYNLDKAKLKTLFSTLIIFNIVFNIFLLIILSFLGHLYFHLLFIDNNIINYFPLGFFAILAGLTTQVQTIYYSFVQNERKIYQYAVVNIISVVLLILLQLLSVINFGLNGIMGAKVISNILLMIIVVIFAKNEINMKINKEILLKSLNFSLPLIPFFFVFWLGRYVDRFFLEKYVSLTQVGIYGLMMTFAMLVTLISQALASAVQPFLFESYQNPHKNQETINKYYLFYIVLLTSFSFLLLVFISNLAFLLPKKEYQSMIPYLWLAIIPTFINGIQYIFFNILTYKLKSKILTLSTLISVGIQVICVFILIKKYLIIGAIISSLIGSIVSIVFISYYGINEMKIKYQWKTLLGYPISFISIIIICVWLYSKFNIEYSTLSLFFSFPFLMFIIYNNKSIILNFIKNKKLTQ